MVFSQMPTMTMQVAPDEVLTIDMDELGGAYACSPRVHTELHLLMHIMFSYKEITFYLVKGH
jgi:hypothetical protein